MKEYLEIEHYLFSNPYLFQKFLNNRIVFKLLRPQLVSSTIYVSKETKAIVVEEKERFKLILKNGTNFKSGLVPIWNENFLDNFNAKWRYELRKGQSHGIKPLIRSLNSIDIMRYNSFSSTKGFVPLSETTLNCFADEDKYQSFVTESTTEEGFIGLAYFLVYQNVLYYIFSVGTENSRRYNTNYTNIHSAIEYARAHFKVDFFDVGGLGENTSVGVRLFKERMNPLSYAICYPKIGLLRKEK